MTAHGDYPHDMANLSEREIDALFAGRSDARDDLSELVKAAKAVAQQAPAPEVERRHLAAIVEEAHTHASHTGLATRSRRDKMRKIFRPAWVKVLAIVGVALAATTGLAAAGAMPQPAQDALSRVAEKLGVDMPPSGGIGQTVRERNDTGTAGEDIEGAEEDENGKSVSDDVHAVLEDESLEGAEKGDAVSGVASQNRQSDTHSHSRVGNPSPSPNGVGPEGAQGVGPSK
jgi:hypothetical protein